MPKQQLSKLWPSIVAGLVWGVTYFAVREVLDTVELDRTAKIVIALIPAIPFGAFLWFFVRGLGRLDEMEQRIQMEALAIAFPLSIFFIMVLGLLQLVVVLPERDWGFRHIWIFLIPFYSFGLAIAMRRYK
jgi:hypothetical protein